MAMSGTPTENPPHRLKVREQIIRFVDATIRNGCTNASIFIKCLDATICL